MLLPELNPKQFQNMKPKPNRNAYILTINPGDRKSGALFREKWLPQMLKTKVHNWSVAANLVHAGEIKARDVFLFLLQGNGPKGIIGFGEILTRANPGKYWATKEPGYFVKVRFGEIIDPFKEPHLVLSRDVLLGLGLHEFEWVRASGRQIDYRTAEDIRNLFAEYVKLGRRVEQRAIKMAA
jgi:hypothetical protein